MKKRVLDMWSKNIIELLNSQIYELEHKVREKKLEVKIIKEIRRLLSLKEKNGK